MGTAGAMKLPSRTTNAIAWSSFLQHFTHVTVLGRNRTLFRCIFWSLKAL